MPVLIGWLRSNPQQYLKVWTCIGIFPFVIEILPKSQIALLGAPGWPGLTRGFEVSLLDLVLLCIYLSFPTRAYRLPFRFAMAFYFFAVLLSMWSADVPEAVLFYAWQLARMFFAYIVIARCSVDDRVPIAIFKGMSMGLCVAACFAIWERGHGVIQASGTFGHQNLLGMLAEFVVLPVFALVLAGWRGWQAPIVLFSGIVVAVLGASRATLGLMGLGFVILFMLSTVRAWTPRKTKILAIGAVVIAIAVPLALSSLSERFGTQSITETHDDRAAFISAASMMLSDYPMGVGANHFTLVDNAKGYADRVNLSWVSRGSRVHNIYWLTAAETGYLGLVALIILLLHPMISAFVCGWRNRKDQRGDLLLGIGVTFLIVYTHSYFEFLFLDSKVQYFYVFFLGMLAGLAQQLGYWQSNPRRAARAESLVQLNDKKVAQT